jgi:shikimate dehydrogenase
VISGGTRVAAVIGSPIRHSLSPALHNAAFRQLGIDWVYVAFHVEHGEAQRAVDAMRVFEIAGLSVTAPHKESIVLAVDALSPAAEALRSVNTVVVDGAGALVGHSTDGAGFIASLSAAGVGVGGRNVCLLGAGGAGRAIADALANSGAARVAVVNRSPEPAAFAASLAGTVGVVGTTADIRDADIVVNATSVGMGSEELPCDPALLRAGQVVADVVYHPRHTALLRAAAAAGATTVDGLGMLVHQAALQQQLWHGMLPDIAAMAEAAERELAARHH